MSHPVNHSEVCRGQPVDDGVRGQAGSPPVWHCNTCGRSGWIGWDKDKRIIHLFSSFRDGHLR